MAQIVSFDTILENKIKQGKYQMSNVVVIGLIEFLDGVEYLFMSFLIQILQKEWNLDSTQISTLGSSFYLGVVFGNFLCAYIADHIGRKRTFQIFCALSVIAIYATSYSTTYYQMVGLRLIFGLVFGTTIPISFVVVTEIALAKVRGRVGYTLTILFICGKLYLVILCFFFLEDYSTGNWRGLIRFNGIPVIIAFLGSLLILRDTARYYLNKGHYKKAFHEILYSMEMNSNQPQDELSNDEKDGLIQWQQKLNRINLRHQQEGEGIYSSKYLSTTLKLWGIYILANYQNMSLYLLMPFLFNQRQSGFGVMLTMLIIELGFGILIYNLVDNARHGGRLKLMLYSAIALLISNTLLYILRDVFLFIGLLIILLCIRVLFSVGYLLTCESFPLYLRSQSFGVSQGIGKLAAIPSPYILFPLYFFDAYLPFALMAILSILLGIIVLIYPSDRTRKHLEKSEENE